MNTKKRRHREPVVGMWLHIQDRHDKGGAPLIRVERIEPSGRVYVTDWLSFEREAPRTQMPGGYTPPRERCFAFDADEFSRRSLRYWRRVQPARRLLGPNPTAKRRVSVRLSARLGVVAST